MDEEKDRTGSVALVQVWGKGFRVTEDTEEFQRCVPSKSVEISLLEKKLATLVWGPILEPLYRMSEREVGAQRCVLFDATQLLAVSFSKSEDKHGRPSIVLTTACVDISWSSALLGVTAARAVGLANRLAMAYADAFRGNALPVANQLRDGVFLMSRAFELDEEDADVTIDWSSVIFAVKRWRGILGVATPRMMTLGANVALGTRHEAERAQMQTRADGFFDIREKAILSLTSALVPWEEPAPIREAVHRVDPEVLSAEPVIHSLNRIANALEILAAIGQEIVHLFGRDKRRK